MPVNGGVFAQAGAGVQSGWDTINSAIIEHNPQAEMIKGYIAAQNLLIQQGQLKVQKDQLSQAAAQFDQTHQLDVDKFSQQKLSDEQNLKYHQAYLELQQAQLDAQIQEHKDTYGIQQAELGIHQQNADTELLKLQKNESQNSVDNAIRIGTLGVQQEQVKTANERLAFDKAKEANNRADQAAVNNPQTNPEGLTQKGLENRQTEENKLMQTYVKQSNDAQSQLNQLGELSKALKDYGPTSGLSKLAVGVGKFAPTLAAGLGINVAAGQTIESLGNTLALKTRSSLEMLGSMSDADRDFLVNIVPGLGKTQAANQQLIKFGQATSTLAKIKPLFMQQYRDKFKNLNYSQEAWDDYMQSYGIVRDGQLKIPSKVEAVQFMNMWPKLSQVASESGVSVGQLVNKLRKEGKIK